MTAQFTPGPWALEKFTVRGENNNVLIGQAYFPRGSKDPSAERKANARLIAAAPELYEALEWIRKIADANLEQDEKLRSQGARTLRRIADKAEEMMAEARGEL